MRFIKATSAGYHFFYFYSSALFTSLFILLFTAGREIKFLKKPGPLSGGPANTLTSVVLIVVVTVIDQETCKVCQGV